jgi:two-component system response regulator HydG
LCSELAVECGWLARTAASTEEALKILESTKVDFLLTDIRVPQIGGMELLKRVRSNFPTVDLLVLTEDETIEKAAEAMRLGAFDYVTKPFFPEDFQQKLRSWVRSSQLGRALFAQLPAHRRQSQLATLGSLVEQSGLIGKCPRMHQAQATIGKVSQLDCSVLILGETGTGKEVAARSIHRLGARATSPFIPVDCASLTSSLIESELFGHSKGAFTGATQRKTGLIEAADTGTLFLDEIGELPRESQAKLLRVLQEREVRPVGSTESRRVNVRVIAATHRDLVKAMNEGTFRDDLYYRLNVVQLRLPPLREREADIPLLVRAFAEKYGSEWRHICQVSEGALKKLMAYDWPGNVRQLENTIERAMALAEGPVLQAQDLELGVEVPAFEVPEEKPQDLSLEAIEKNAIYRALRETGGDKLAAAHLLGIGKSTLYRRMRSYGPNFFACSSAGTSIERSVSTPAKFMS